MSLEIKGLNTLMNKLNRLSSIEGKKAVEKVASVVEDAIKEGASWAPDSQQYIQKCDIREYNNSYFVDIGIKNDGVDWDKQKHLFYHNYGYWQHYFGHPTGEFTNMHLSWFNNAVTTIEGPVVDQLKKELKAEIKKCLEG